MDLIESFQERFFEVQSFECELNSVIIEIYGLQDELTPEVPLKDITILQEELDSDDLEALEDVVWSMKKKKEDEAVGRVAERT